MRKTKAFKIDDREYSARELTVRQILALVQQDDDDQGDLLARLDKLLAAGIQGLDRETAMDMAPSELRQVWDNFAEVNEDFLALAAKLGLSGLVEEMRREITAGLTNLPGSSVLSSPPATDQPPGTTAGRSSAKPPKPSGRSGPGAAQAAEQAHQSAEAEV